MGKGRGGEGERGIARVYFLFGSISGECAFFLLLLFSLLPLSFVRGSSVMHIVVTDTHSTFASPFFSSPSVMFLTLLYFPLLWNLSPSFILSLFSFLLPGRPVDDLSCHCHRRFSFFSCSFPNFVIIFDAIYFCTIQDLLKVSLHAERKFPIEELRGGHE